MQNQFIKDCQLNPNISQLLNADSIAVAEVSGETQLIVGGSHSNSSDNDALQVKYILPGVSADKLGDASFKQDYGIKYAYYAGGMANAISSVEMAIALGKAGFMGSYGAGGMSISEIEKAIDKLNSVKKGMPYLINYLSSANSPSRELELVKMFIYKGVTAVEASAFIELSAALIYYKVSGLKRLPSGKIECTRKIIAKLSREEVAVKFMSPAPHGMIKVLLNEKLITPDQANMAEKIPVADDITVEADSGGHTDNRPLVSLFPAIVSLRDKIQQKYIKKSRIGAAGGISTPESALAAFQMGAAYVVTGSVNQSCVEAGTSAYVKEVLSTVTMPDVVMAPCADLFELGTKVQVIKKGTMYPMIAQKLYDFYTKYKSIDDLTENEKKRLEKTYFKCSIDKVWEDVQNFFKSDPKQLALAEKNGKVKMAMLFRWYLGNSSKWAIDGLSERKMDMQIWCGQSMGAFNNWCKGTELENPKNRNVSHVAQLIMDGAACLWMKNIAGMAGVNNFPKANV